MSKTVSSRISIVNAALLFAFFGVATVGMGCFGGSGREAVHGGPEVTESGVIFRFYDPDASRVCVVGDFNGWSPNAHPMVDDNADGQWTLFCNLPPGAYPYKFVVDGTRWIPDPKNFDRAPDGFDSENSIVRVPPR
jgi:1,4-alpha-glucan branching enzyme